MTTITLEDRRRPQFVDKSDHYILAYLAGEKKWRDEEALRKAGSVRADAAPHTPSRPQGAPEFRYSAAESFRTDAAPSTPRSAAQASRNKFLVEQAGVSQQRADAMCANVEVAGIDRERADSAAAFEARLLADRVAYEARFAKSAAEKARLRMTIRQDMESRGSDGFTPDNLHRPTAAVHFDVAPPIRTTSAAEARARLHGRSNANG